MYAILSGAGLRVYVYCEKSGMRVLFALPGLHRHNRGAEIAFISIARELAKAGDSITLIGSGNELPSAPYRFLHASSVGRERFAALPSLPILRSAYIYEELTFVPGLLRRYSPAEYDVTITCSYPFTNWALRRSGRTSPRPPHVFVTQNGDWPAFANNWEYRLFGCEGLVCTNPDFYERNKARWRCRLIPNGVDCCRFRPEPGNPGAFDLPANRLLVLMVSALIPSKRVETGIEAVSRIPDAHLIVAGDGPLRQAIEAASARLLPGRFTRLSVAPEDMPALYQSADVFLHLSKEESFGNVYLEAMACGLPIVACDSPRLRWIVGDDEFLLTDDDPEAIAAQVRRARAAPDSQRHGRARRALAFSWPSIAAMYRSFLQEVVDLRQKSVT
jgi:glycosyltransferase involved in cell wall biosynthesis